MVYDKFDKRKIVIYRFNYIQLNKLFIYNYCKMNFI